MEVEDVSVSEVLTDGVDAASVAAALDATELVVLAGLEELVTLSASVVVTGSSADAEEIVLVIPLLTLSLLMLLLLVLILLVLCAIEVESVGVELVELLPAALDDVEVSVKEGSPGADLSPRGRYIWAASPGRLSSLAFITSRA